MIAIKSRSEIELMRKAGDVVEGALELIREAVKPGVATVELDRIAEEHIRRNGAIPSFKGYKSAFHGAIDYPGSICASVNNEVVHGIPGLKQLKDGDIISIDIGAYLSGYHADAARTFPVGQVSEIARQLIDVTRESFFSGIDQAKPGKRIFDISAAIQDYVERYGFSVVREYVGHGIGREMHEPPQIPNYRTREKGPRLEPGMVLAIEPMVNEGKYDVFLLDNKWTVVTLDGSLSAHYENTVAISEEGPVLLTLSRQ